METVFEKFGLTDALIVSRAQLKQIAGGADPNPVAPNNGTPLNCICTGSTGCWYYPGVNTPEAASGVNTGMDLLQNCASGQGFCSFTDLCGRR